MFCIGQLEEKYLMAQKGITAQTRKNIDLKKELQKSQAEVEELRKEVQCVQMYHIRVWNNSDLLAIFCPIKVFAQTKFRKNLLYIFNE